MGYHVVYVTSEDGEQLQDGDQIATGHGWLAWINWAARLAKRFPAVAFVALEGWAESPEAIAGLERELEKLAGKGPLDVAGVTGALLEAVKARPAGTVALFVTDGTSGPPDEDEEE